MKRRDVSVIIFHNKDKILLQKRSLNAKRFPGKWGLFGGGLDQNESPKQAIIREIKEELSVQLKNVHLINKYNYILKEKDERGIIFVFKAKYNNEYLKLLEGEEMEWVNIEECLKYDLHPYYRKIIIDISQKQNFMVF